MRNRVSVVPRCIRRGCPWIWVAAIGTSAAWTLSASACPTCSQGLALATREGAGDPAAAFQVSLLFMLFVPAVLLAVFTLGFVRAIRDRDREMRDRLAALEAGSPERGLHRSNRSGGMPAGSPGPPEGNRPKGFAPMPHPLLE